MSSSRTSAGIAEVTMPQPGVSVAEGTITAWRKQPGDDVAADEPIADIETDKIETEIPAPVAGRLKEILVEPGTTVEVGTVLATIDTGGDGDGGAPAGKAVLEEEAADAQAVQRASAEQPAKPEPALPDPAEAEPSGPAPAARGDGDGDGHGPFVTPVVRRMAEEHDVDLSQVEGSGRRGRVTKKDLLAYLKQRDAGEAAPRAEKALHMESPYREEAPAASQPAPETPARGGQELSTMRKRIAEHMVRSLHTAAHCTTIVEADMSRIEAARGRLSYLPFVARATIAALREHPTLNATLDGDRLTVHEEVHLGIAVSLGAEGLIVPVVRNAHELSEEGLAARIRDLAERARSKRLSPEDVGGGTFTITNPGAAGSLVATPIINQPQVAILDLEAVVKRPVVVTDPDGQDSIAIRPMTYLCMSWDHRALDGMLAAQFLSTLKGRLESWS